MDTLDEQIAKLSPSAQKRIKRFFDQKEKIFTTVICRNEFGDYVMDAIANGKEISLSGLEQWVVAKFPAEQLDEYLAVLRSTNVEK